MTDKYEISFTGVILAGGKSSRMAGQNKAFLSLDTSSIINRLVDLFRRLFHEVIIVTNEPADYYGLDVKIATDISKAAAPLAGIHSGLFHASAEWIFAIPCDLPFLTEEMISLITGSARPEISIVIPRTEAGFEPLCAAYSKQNLPKIERNLNEGNYRLLNFHKKRLTRIIPETRLREVDPELISFFNVNTPDDLAAARRLICTESI